MIPKFHYHVCVLLGIAGMTAAAQPLITTQPQSQNVNQGFDAPFRVTASGLSLAYQWFFQNTPIGTVSTNVLTLTNAQPKDAGDYLVVITGAGGSVTSKVARLTVVLPVPLDPKVGLNTPIGADAPGSVYPDQGEIHIARSDTDPQLLMAVFQDQLASGLPLVSSYAVSQDGGGHWQRAFIPEASKETGGSGSYSADNVAAIDSGGILFQIAGSFSASDAYTISSARWIFSMSPDHGQTFSKAVTLATNDALSYPDKGWLGINTYRALPNAGRIAFSYTKAAQSGLTGQTYVCISDDHGTTWSPQVAVGPNRTTGSQIFFLPDGQLVVLYRTYAAGTGPIPNSGPGHIEMVLSSDGGKTFGAPVLVQDLTGKIYTVFPKEWDSVNFPSACTDGQAGVIYVTYQAFDPNRAKSVMFTRSIDKGLHWSDPIRVNDTPSNFDVFNPALAVSPDGQHVVIEFYDQRNQTTNSGAYAFDLYLAESFDGGETWGPNIRLTEFSSDLRKAAVRSASGGLGAFLGDYQAIAPSLNLDVPAVAAWIDTRAGNNDPYSVRIQRTQGATFEAWRHLRFATNDLANPDVSGELADPDGDAIPNLLEFVLGTEPNRRDSPPFKVSLDSSGPTSRLVVSFERLATLTGVQLSWESSSDLLHWSPAQPVDLLESTGHEVWLKQQQVAFQPSALQQFFRLRVTSNLSGP